MSELQYDYALWNEEGREPRHVWSVVGEDGGIHIWAVEKSPGLAARFGGRFYGGIESHWRRSPYGEDEPHHEDCWLLKGPCYHDGSSLYFEENIAPMLGSIKGDAVPDGIHEYLKSELAEWYRSKIGGAA